MERTLDLHAKIAASSPDHRERIERSLFADAEYPGKQKGGGGLFVCIWVDGWRACGVCEVWFVVVAHVRPSVHRPSIDGDTGCLLTGFLLVNRVPGNFHIEVRTPFHPLSLSHTHTHTQPTPPPSHSTIYNAFPKKARSKYHNLNPTLTNVSHVVHDLTFGPPMTKEYRDKLHVRLLLCFRLVFLRVWLVLWGLGFRLSLLFLFDPSL